MRGRALTNEEKRAVLDRIYVAWTATRGASFQRLGQLIANSVADSAYSRSDIFYIKDKALVEVIEEHAVGYRREPKEEDPK